jgi:hypothetical protein
VIYQRTHKILQPGISHPAEAHLSRHSWTSNRLVSSLSYGIPANIGEWRAVLEQYGAIESIWYPIEDQTLVLRFYGAVLMLVAFFDDDGR